MENKRIYIIEIGLLKIGFESKEKAVKLWELLTESNIKRFREMRDWDMNAEGFSWLESLPIELKCKDLPLYKDEKEAKLGKDNYDRVKRMKLLSKKKKRP